MANNTMDVLSLKVFGRPVKKLSRKEKSSLKEYCEIIHDVDSSRILSEIELFTCDFIEYHFRNNPPLRG